MQRTKQNEENRRYILSNDPSMTAWGWAVLDWQGRIMETGCIKTEKSKNKLRRVADDLINRIELINKTLNELFNEYNIRLIVSELPHGSQNASAAVMIGMIAGMVQTQAQVRELPIEWYSEGDVKKLLFNRQSVSKTEMIDKIDTLYDVVWHEFKYMNEAVADALAIHYTASFYCNLLKL